MNRISRNFIFRVAIALSIASACVTVQANEATLCQQHEEIYFSCPSGKKIISLCASGNLSPNYGYVQYRFGTPDRIEFKFPSGSQSPRKRFSIVDITGGNLNIEHVRFRSGDYDYVIYQGPPNGVYVKRSGETVANLICEKGIYQRLSQRAYRGISTSSPIDDVDN